MIKPSTIQAITEEFNELDVQAFLVELARYQKETGLYCEMDTVIDIFIEHMS